MITLVAQDTKEFMNLMIRTDAFDNFWVYEAGLDTLYHIFIDGKINDNYLSSDEKELYSSQTHIDYPRIKPLITDVLKGGHTPTSMKITFMLNQKSTMEIQHRILGETATLPINGFLINIHYDGVKVRITTGTNYANFTLDKSIEQSFDQMIRQFFRKHEILMLEDSN